MRNWRGKKRQQINIINSCYKRNYRKFDWLIFYDIDEYIFLKNYKNKHFLSEPRFNNCQIIQLNWLQYTDNNLIYYENKSLLKRFTEKDIKAKKNITNITMDIKSIIRGHIGNIKLTNIHYLTKKIKGCDGFGRKIKLNNIRTLRPDYQFYYIKHFFSKSLEEFIEKVNRGTIYYGLDQNRKIRVIERYFEFNKITIKKIKIIEKKTGLNLTSYRNNLIKGNN